MQPINHNNNFLFQSVFEALEERVLFDGVPDAAFILPADAATTVPAQVQDLNQADAELPRELIVVDPGVEDADALLTEILETHSGSAFEIRLLDANSDGVQQITDVLAQSDGKYDAIHVISHGDAGQVTLGDTQLTSESFGDYVDQLASWNSALTDNADILFYGCDLAGNAEGEQFIESISAITGADVAASDDLTGAADRGGDWDLEKIVGTVETITLSATSYAGVLATPFSFGDMLAAGGLTLPTGITATATAIEVAGGVAGASHGDTGLNPASLGGNFNSTNTGFAEATNPIGEPETATRVNANPTGSLVSSDFSSSVGFKISFSAPVPASHFYGVDLDGTEWKTSWGTDASGNTVRPTVTLDASTVLTFLDEQAVPQAAWEASIPGLTAPANLDFARSNGGSVSPGDHDSQVLFDYGGTPVTELYFLFGLDGGNPAAVTQRNSGIGAINLDVPDLEVVKNVTSADLQADGSYDLTYEVLVENTGDVPFNTLTLTDDLADAANLGTAFNGITSPVIVTPVTSTGGSDFPVANANFDGDGDPELLDPTDPVVLEVGDSFTVTFTVNVVTDGTATVVANSATAAGEPEGYPGASYSEQSDDDADESNGDNPTQVTLPEVQDKDGDGVPDSHDIDQDNDGILDTEECEALAHTDGVRFVVGHHTTGILTPDGRLLLTGDDTQPNGTSNHNTFTEVNPDNGYAYTGNIIDFAIAGLDSPQYILATTDGLYSWGAEGQAVPAAYTTGTAFEQIALPPGVSAADVVAVDASNDSRDLHGVAAILTTTGEVWVSGDDHASSYGDGSTVLDSAWHQVLTAPGVPLTGVTELEMSVQGGFAVTAGGVYAWGQGTFLGDGTGASDTPFATLMTLHADFTSTADIVEIELSIEDNDPNSYAMLHSNGKLYTLGSNHRGELGQNTLTADITSWGIVQNPAGTADMENIFFVDGQSHSQRQFVAGFVFLADDPTIAGSSETYFMGRNSGDAMTEGVVGATGLPEIPTYYLASYTDVTGDGNVDEADFNASAIALSSHLSVYYDESQQSFAFSGHNEAGAFGQEPVVEDRFVVSAVPLDLGLDCDTDGDGIPDHLDLDSDNDGISDLEESGQDPSVVDTDGDGVVDGGVNSDGIPLAANGGAGVDPVDSDGDGLEDYLDLDSDNDGIPDVVEGQPTTGYVPPSGTDSDGDGVDDAWDTTTGHGGDFVGTEDTDSDGTPDYLDTDSDGDGASDSDESGLPLSGTDADGDGIDDGVNASYSDPDGDVNTPIDDLENATDNDLTDADYRSVNDTDGDGVADFEDLDKDNDGILDSVEGISFTLDANGVAVTSKTYSSDGSTEIPPTAPAFTLAGPNLYQSFDQGTFGTAVVPPDDGDSNTSETVSPATNPYSGAVVDHNGNNMDSEYRQYTPGTSGANKGSPNFGEFSFVANIDDAGKRNNGQAFPVTDPVYGREGRFFTADPDSSAVPTLSDTITGLTPGEFYEYSFWAANPENGNPNSIGVQLGQPGGPLVEVMNTGGLPRAGTGTNEGAAGASSGVTWTRFSFVFQAPASGQVQLDLASTGNAAAGNDLLIDNLELRSVVTDIDTDGDGVPDHCDLDSDNDGISDLEESGQDPSVVDTDGDGVHDGPVDPTTGIPLAANGGAGVDPVDSDGDGLDDYLDLDSDDDGIPDVVEGQPTNGYVPPSGMDSDGDGVDDAWDTTTGHGGDFVGTEDTDGDGTPDYLDTDSDGDGASDSDESGLPLSGTDADGDGIDDGVNASYSDPDGDVNTPIDDLENATDNDLTDADYRSVNDKDGDGVADFEDLDDDNDGILDTDEGNTFAGSGVTFEGAATVDPADTQASATNNWTSNFNFGVTDANLVIRSPDFVADAAGSPYYDLIEGDSFGVIQAGNNTPLNGNNDGLGFSMTAAELTALGFVVGSDIDLSFNYAPGNNFGGSGTGTASIFRPTDADSTVAIWYGNGSVASFGGLAATPTDSVQTGAFVSGPTVNGEPTMPAGTWQEYSNSFTWTGGDIYYAVQGLTGATDSGFENIFVDNFQIGQVVTRDTDGDGLPDHCDLDSDNDGISDLEESGQDPSVVDTDGDGVHDGPVDPTTGIPLAANGGAGVDPVDSDGDGLDDYLDLDSDDDGIPDVVEGQPTDGYIPPSGVDSDGDGVDDAWDSTVGHGGDFVGTEDTDGDGTPDYLDEDSDNDGVDDIDESGLPLSGTDADGDGIDDGVGASYSDPDGTVNDPDADLDNEFGDTSEVGYRELNAELGVAKEVFGGPTLQADGSYAVTYQVVVENTGSADMENLSVVDDLATQFGAAFVSASNLTLVVGPSDPDSSVSINSAYDGDLITQMIDPSGSGSNLVEGDSFTVQFDVVINPTNSALDNQVTASGTGLDPQGNPIVDENGDVVTVTDTSDSGADADGTNPGEAGDTGGSDDPTPLYLPGIGLAKEAGDAVANGDNFDVQFTLNWVNSGNVALDGVEIFDDIAAQFGAQFVDAQITAVTTSGTANVMENTAWEGPTGDTTQSMILHTGDDLAVGDTITVVFTVTIDPDAAGTSTSGLENQATSNGTGVNPDTGAPDPALAAEDTSDNGTDPLGENAGDENNDGTFGNDPTPIAIPDIAVAKQVVGTATPLSNGNFSVTYQLVIENTGNVNLADISVDDAVATQFGSAFVSAGSLTLSSGPGNVDSNIVLDSANWDGNAVTEMVDQGAANLLAVGDSFVVQFTAEVDPDAAGAPNPLNNQATAEGAAVDEDGNPILGSDGMTPLGAEDDSDSGADPNGDNPGEDGDTGGSDDPTPLLIPSVGLAKSAGDAVPNGDNFDITFTFVYENNGTVDLTNLSLSDDIATEFGNAYVEVVAGSLAVTPTSAATPPGANAAWEADTALDMLDGTGVLAVGESFEVSFTVTIDPDGIDSVSQGLENQGTAAADGINPDTGAADPDLSTTDDSDNGTDPDTENGEDDMDGVFGNDPTPIVIADISAAKQVVGTPTQLANGNFEATYQVVIENSGTVDLANLTLSEDLATQFGAAYVDAYGLILTTPPSDPTSSVALDTAGWDGSSATEIVNTTVPSLLAVGDSFIFEFTVEIDAAAATGVLDNTVTAGGSAVDENGDPITDSSGDPITAEDDSDSGTDPSDTNAGDPGDTGGSDDPTPLLIPDIGLAKEAGDPVANGDNWDVTFTLNWENTGTVALDSVEILDDIAAQFGGQFVGATIDSVATSGTATIAANALWAGDTTQSLITHTGDDLAVGDTITVEFTVTIDPDAAGTSTSGLENQATSTGTGVNPDTGAPDPDLMAEDTSDNGTDPDGDNGDDENGDGVSGNDPTPIVIADIAVAKEVSGTPTPLANGNFEVTYSLVIENNGNVDLAGLTLVEDLGTQFGSALISAGSITLATPPADASSNVVLDSAWDGSGTTEMVDQTASTQLAVGDSFVVEFTVEVDPDAVGAPATLDNQVTAGGDAVDENGDPITDSNGDPIVVSDDSDSGADPNGTNPDGDGDAGTSDDPTPLLIPDLGLAKSASDAVPNGDNFDVTFTFVIENNGTVDMTNLSLTDDIMAEFGNAFVSATAPTVANFVGTGTAPGANAGWAADSTQSLLDGTGQLNIGDSFEVSFTVTIDPDGIDSVSQALENQGTIAGDGINPDTGLADPALAASDDSDNGTSPDDENGEGGLDDPTPIIIADVSAAKQVVGTPTLLSNGNFEAVYEVVIENTGTVDLANLTLAEDLATQFGAAYVNAYGLTLTTPPADADSAIALSSTWDGGTATEIVNTAVPSALAVGDSFVFQFSVEIDAAAATGVLDNTVTVGGDAVDENGDPITDSSGNPITATDDSDSGADPSDPNSGAPGDNGTTDDPTPLLIPNLSLAKEAGDAVANGDDFDVEFTLVWENTGTVALDGVDLFDDIATQFGGQFVEIVPGSLSVSSFAGTGSAPTANAAWEGDTTQSLISATGPLEVGDTFEVTFSVTIDPDAGGTSSEGLENQATSNGTGINPDTGAPDPSLAASDDSDNGTDPTAENGEDNGDGVFGNDPTPIIIPDVSVTKEVSGTPTPLANGNFEVTYSLVIENTGNVDLANLTLVEDLATQFGSALVSAGSITLATPPADASSNVVLDSSWDGSGTTEMVDQAAATLLAVGDSFVVEFTTEVDPDAVGAPGALDNQVTVGGDAVDENGDPISDSSGTPIVVSDDSDSGADPNGDNPGAPGDMGTTDDPTPLLIPDLGLAKSASDAVPNGDNFDVTFTFVVENNGTVDMTNLSLTDDIMAEFGNAFVSATAPTVANFVGTGTAPGANAGWAADSTQSLLDGTGQLNIGDSFEVSFTVTIDPDGIDSVSQALENQGTIAGDGINPDTGLADPALAATDDSDNGTDPDAENGEDNGDGTFGNDPTPIVIADIAAAKQIVGTPVQLDNGNFEATYQVVIENNGTVDLANLTLSEDLATQFGAAYVDAYDLALTTPPADPSSSVVLDTAGWDGSSTTEIVNTAVPSLLAVGDSFVFEFKVEIDAAAATGVLENTVTAGGSAVDENGDPLTDSNGDPITATDDSDSGTDPSDDNPGAPGDNGTSDDPTPLYIPSIGLAKEAGDAVANGDNFDVTFTLNWENTGTVALDGVEMFDDIAAQFGGQFVSAAIDSVATSGSATVAANGLWAGDTTQSLITHSGDDLAVGDTVTVEFTVTIDPDAAGTSTAGLENQATSNGTGVNPDTGAPDPALAAEDTSDNGTDPVGDNGDDENGDGVSGNDPTPIVIADIAVAKEVSGTPTALPNGNFSVTYSLVIENNGNVDLAGLTLVEDLATQFGTAMVSAGNITLSTPPADAASSITLDAAWDGSGTTEMVDQTASTQLAVGDSFVVEFTVEVDPDAVGAPATLDNQVTVGGDAVDENGDPITDSNGDPIVATDDSDSGADPNGTNPDGDGDAGTSDDPTPLLIADIGLAKSASDAVPNGDNFDITFTFVYENNGTVDMTNLSLTDDIMAQFGNAFVSATGLTVNPGATVDPPAANALWMTDTTLDMLDGTGTLEVGESIEVQVTVTIDPDGIDSVSQGLENQATAAGDGINPDTGAADPALAATDDSDNGTDPDAENGEDNGDGTFGNDPTPIIIADVSAAKQVVGTPTLLSNGNFEAVYEVVIENTGTVDLANLTLAEDLATQFGAAYVNAYGLTLTTPPADADSAIALSSTWDGGTATEIVNTAVPSALAVGDSFVFQFSVEIDAAAATGVLDNTVTVGGDAVDENGDPITDSSGNPITATDDSDSGADPSDPNSGAPGDNGTTDDPTPLLIPNLSLAKEAGDAVANGDDFDVEFTLVWENTGTVALDGVDLFDDIATQFGGQFVEIVPGSLSVSSFAGTGSAPTANAAWEGDTTQSLITATGPLEVGDTFEVTFSVTIDPDAGGTSSEGLENQATSNGTGINPDTGAPDPSLAASDDSDNGTDPTAENGEDNGDGVFGNDPTPIIIPDISVAKSVAGTPVPLDNGNFAVTYELVIENTGNVDLANLTLVEDLATQFGSALVSAGSITLATPPAAASSAVLLDSAWNGDSSTEMIDQAASTLLAVGDSFTVSFLAEVDPDAVGAPATLDNQVTAGGDAVDETGAPISNSNGDPIVVSDDSDTGSNPNNTNPGAQGDTGGSDDPTPLLIPDISVGKIAGDARPDGDDWVVHFRLFVENTGTVTLDNPTLFDDIAAEFGNAFVSVDGVDVVNFVGTGVAPGVNTAWAGDTSQDILDGTGSLDVGDRYQVVFHVTIDPDGIDDVSQGLTNQATAGGDGVNPDGTPMTDSSGNPIQATDDSDNGTDVHGENGEDNGDGVANNDPTPIIIADLGLAKSVVGTPELLSNGNYDVTYQLVVENTGTVDLANLSLVEDLSAEFGAGYVDAGALTLTAAPTGTNSSVTLDGNWDGSATTELVDAAAPSLLEVGDSFTLEFTVEVDAAALPLPTTNTVSGSGDAVDADGTPLADASGEPIVATDDSDSGADPNGGNPGEPGDNGTSDDPTPLLIPDISVGKTAGDARPDGDDWVVHFRLFVENTGNVALDNPTLHDDIAAQFGGTFVSVDNIAVVNFNGTGIAPGINAGWAGDTSQNILDGTGSLDVGDRYQVVFRVTLDPDAADVPAEGLTNQATAGGDGLNPDGSPLTDSSGNPVQATDVSDNGTDGQSENGEDNGDGVFGNDPTPISIADLGLAKSIVGEPALTDQGNFVVTFELVVENTGTVDLGSLSLIEDLSTQFGAAFVSAGNVVLTSPPSDPGSNAIVDTTGFDGSGSPELLDTTSNNALVVGDSFTIQFDVEINPMEVDGALENQVEGTGDGVDANGDPILDSNGDPLVASDVSDSGTDPDDDNTSAADDRGTSDDPTLFAPPEIPTSEFSGSVFQDDNNNGTRDPGEAGIEGVEVTLTGTDVYGNAVELTVLTDANGDYTFDNLVAGDYGVAAAQPDGFEDGLDSANAAFSTGNDEITEISLGFGESYTGNTFGERQPGTTGGNPSRLPPIGPISAQRLSNRISGFLAGPGTIYSGVPIASNSNPLTLDSSRPITGGYATEFASPDVATDCGCPEVIETPCDVEVPCEPCGEEVIQETVCEPCEQQEVVSDCECQVCEEPVACEECGDCDSCCDCGGLGQRGGFLFRFKNWLSR